MLAKGTHTIQPLHRVILSQERKSTASLFTSKMSNSLSHLFFEVAAVPIPLTKREDRHRAK